jgi:hypothetical protein
LRLTASIYICISFFQLNTCGYSPYVTSFLTRGWVCRLQLLLVISAVIPPAGLMTIFCCLETPPTWRGDRGTHRSTDSSLADCLESDTCNSYYIVACICCLENMFTEPLLSTEWRNTFNRAVATNYMRDIYTLILGEENKLSSFSLCSFLQSPFTSSLFGTNILLSTLFSDTLNVCFSP